MRRLVNVVLLGLVLGCGGDSESSGVDTGLPESMVLRDVTSADAITACQNIRGTIEREFGVEQTVSKACELMGAALTDDSAACRMQADSCVTQTNEGRNPLFERADLDFAAALECDGDTSAYTDCELTVGELESCLDARMQQVKELFSQFTCDAAASVGITDAQGYISQLGNRETPPACQRVQEQCPNAEPFGGEGGDE